MEAPRLISFSSLYLLGDKKILDKISGNRPDVIQGVAISVAKDGNKVYWRLSDGGDWVLVKVPGYLYLEGYPGGRQPVEGMGYLPILPGERFEGRMDYGKRRRYSVYAVVLTAEGVTLTPVDRHTWGDRANDITGTSVRTESSPEVSQEPTVYSTRAQEENDPEESAIVQAFLRAGVRLEP